MPLKPIPIFRPDVLAPRVKGFELPGEAQAGQDLLNRWVKLFRSKRGQEYKESELRADFVTHVFLEILGYTSPVSDDQQRYTLSREKLVEVDGKFADAVLGDFTTEDEESQPIVAVEGKGPKDPLDRAYGGRALSAVDQGYRYAINLPCDWIIVTNLQEIRLYYKGSTQRTYERFEVEELAEDDLEYRRFVFLLGAERVVPEAGRCHLYDLLEASEAADEEVTQEFYGEYAEMRQNLLDALREHNSSLSPKEAIAATQKLLDRVLFIAFCEDRGLLPGETLKDAYERTNPYNPQPVWENFQGLFRAIDQGRADLKIPAYNGGLFARDPIVQALDVPDEVCEFFRRLGDYDYRSAAGVGNGSSDAGERALIDVEILGHIFEQSITDLEELRTALAGGDEEEGRTRRQREGAFYTPAYITEHIVSEALQPVLEKRFEALRERHQDDATGTSVSALDDPRIYDLDELNNPQRDALIEFWKAWLEELKTIRVVDPACGSGAFLIEAFDQLYAEYQQMSERLDELRESRSSSEQLSLQLDPNRTILQNNLYGVDLNEEAVQICRLSIWIKTAERGKELTDLDENIRPGNSIIDDPSVHDEALDWEGAFPEVFAAGGFDVVVGNPPYVRAEQLTEFKPHLKANYETYHGTADLYVYFFELGVRLLRPGGRLSYIVTNKWLKVGYAEPLRQFFAGKTSVESVLDLGHAREVFPDADVFPSILAVEKVQDDPAEGDVEVCVIPRDEVNLSNLGEQIRRRGYHLPQRRFGGKPWSLEPPGVSSLMEKLEQRGTPLDEYLDEPPKYGIKTGRNRAFLVDDATRKKLVKEDSSASEVLVPFLRGQDIKRWSVDFVGRWMILLKSSGDYEWPWSNAGEKAEEVFAQTYPSIYEHLKPHKDRLQSRSDQGEHWWELRTCSYYSDFERPKIVHTDIAWRAEFAYVEDPMYLLNTAYMWPADDLYLLGVVNSPVMWSYMWRNATHGKDEALRLIRSMVTTLPIAEPSDATRSAVEDRVAKLIKISQQRLRARDQLLDWLRVEFDIDKPGSKLETVHRLDSDSFVEEVRNRLGSGERLTASDVAALRQEFSNMIGPVQKLLPKPRRLESEVAQRVNEAYGLTEEEVDLLWRTAPPRMPGEDPRQSTPSGVAGVGGASVA